MVDRTKWKAKDKRRRYKILKILLDGKKSFTKLLTELRKDGTWARQTLTLYLNQLVADGCLEREKHGKGVTYSIIPTNPLVRDMLGDKTIERMKHMAIFNLNEEEFINSWIDILKFALIPIIQDYIWLGQNQRQPNDDPKLLNWRLDILETHVQDLREIIMYDGKILAKHMEDNTMNSKKIQEICGKIIEDIIKKKG